MSVDYKERAKQAIESYIKKQDAPEVVPQVPKKTRGKPEKLVEAEVLAWCRMKGFDVDTVEAKARYNVQTRRYTGRAASFGFSDICGNSSNGIGVFIELKARSRRVGSALRPQQRAFLERKIRTNCFAVVVDSFEYIDRVFNHYVSLATREERIAYLLSELPTHSPRNNAPLFED